MEKECLFCKIWRGEIPSEEIYREDDILVIKDKFPKAPIHFLIIPKEHIETFLDLENKHFPILTKSIKVIQKLIKEQKIEGGYRVVINGGRYQEIPHLHLHLLGD
jgi:histidine triad (HIT) family protein